MNKGLEAAQRARVAEHERRMRRRRAAQRVAERKVFEPETGLRVHFGHPDCHGGATVTRTESVRVTDAEITAELAVMDAEQQKERGE